MAASSSTLSIAALSSRPLTVKSKGGSSGEASKSYTYTLRGLTDESEVIPWSVFCASVFAEKPNPPTPEYFQRHYFNDPQRRIDFVRVAVYHSDDDDEPDQIVASCRIFCRELSTGRSSSSIRTLSSSSSTTIPAAGIGEVCTLASHRQRGLSKALLQDCLSIMRAAAAEQFQVSLLHSASQFVSVYESVGYTCVPTKWMVIPISSSLETAADASSRPVVAAEDAGNHRIRLAEFPADTTQLQALHRAFSEQQFAGCVIRSTDYWNDYISNELQGSLFVVEQASGGGKIVAWMSVRVRNEKLQLREFGLADDALSTNVLVLLLSHAISNLEGGSSCTNKTLAIPTLVLERIEHKWGRESLSCFQWEQATSDDDHGWMYQSLVGDELLPAIVSHSHVIWPSDSF
jgi:predicted GNAT family N-acyltransferase